MSDAGVDVALNDPEPEQAAWSALRLARAGAEQIQPDRWDTRDGETFGWVSAGKLEAAARELLFGHDLLVEFRGASAKGSWIETRWRWRHDAGVGWISEETPILAVVDSSRGGVSAAVTSARKVFLRQLLEIHPAEDAESVLIAAKRAADAGVASLVRDLLAATARRYEMSRERILSQTCKVDRFERLTDHQVFLLGAWLTLAIDGKWDPGQLGDLAPKMDEVPF